MMMAYWYDPVLVTLSFLIATLASYAALDLAGHVTIASGWSRRGWIVIGAVAMGIGIWSMHFVAMLAFHLPVPIAYDFPQVLVSVTVAMGASLLALLVVSRPELRLSSLIPAAFIMGAAIAGMHYVGMASMRVPAAVHYDFRIVGLSIGVAIVASGAALWLAFRFRSDRSARGRTLKAASALVMGVAISGMHYTGMAAAHFFRAAAELRSGNYVLATGQLGTAIVVGTLVVLGLAIAGGIVDRELGARTAINARLRQALAAEQRARIEGEAATAALRASEEQLRQVQKMEAIGNLAGGVAHDLNNLLTVVRFNAEMLHDVVPDERRADLEELVRSTDRAAELTSQLLAFGRRQFMNPENTSLNDVIHGMQTLVQRLTPESIEIVLDLDPALGVALVDRGRMEQVITNLLLNSIRAMPEGGHLRIQTRNARSKDSALAEILPPGEYVVLAVEDDGCGMPDGVRQRALEPFFTTKGPGEGSGLGLSTVYGIIKQSAGEMEITSEEGKGTAVRIFLPLVGVPEVKSAEPIMPSTTLRGNERILVVEDQEAVRIVARRILVGAGYRLMEAENGDDALTKYRSQMNDIDLVLTDLVMPKMGGRELVARLRSEGYERAVLFMSGYSAESGRTPGDRTRILEKPFSAARLRDEVRAALDSMAPIRKAPALQEQAPC